MNYVNLESPLHEVPEGFATVTMNEKRTVKSQSIWPWALCMPAMDSQLQWMYAQRKEWKEGRTSEDTAIA